MGVFDAIALMLHELIKVLWWLLPAIIANITATYFGGRWIMDRGRVHHDGRRLLGDGKTWSGLLGGTLAGFTIASLLYWWDPLSYGFGWDRPGIIFIILMANGALWGDVIASFIKRRLDRKRGARFEPWDQYDWLIGAFMLTAPFYVGWYGEHLLSGETLMALIVVIPFIFIGHRVINIIGHAIGWKDVPW